jgi:hypothetical protein
MRRYCAGWANGMSATPRSNEPPASARAPRAPAGAGAVPAGVQVHSLRAAMVASAASASGQTARKTTRKVMKRTPMSNDEAASSRRPPMITSNGSGENCNATSTTMSPNSSTSNVTGTTWAFHSTRMT